MQDGTLDFSRGEFFSGMTDEALQRQAMLTWNLAPVFGKMEDGSRVAVVVGDGTASRTDRPAGAGFAAGGERREGDGHRPL